MSRRISAAAATLPPIRRLGRNRITTSVASARPARPTIPPWRRGARTVHVAAPPDAGCAGTTAPPIVRRPPARRGSPRVSWSTRGPAPMTSAVPIATRAPRCVVTSATPTARHSSMAKYEPAALTSPYSMLIRVARDSRSSAGQPSPVATAAVTRRVTLSAAAPIAPAIAIEMKRISRSRCGPTIACDGHEQRDPLEEQRRGSQGPELRQHAEVVPLEQADHHDPKRTGPHPDAQQGQLDDRRSKPPQSRAPARATGWSRRPGAAAQPPAPPRRR